MCPPPAVHRASPASETERSEGRSDVERKRERGQKKREREEREREKAEREREREGRERERAEIGGVEREQFVTVIVGCICLATHSR